MKQTLIQRVGSVFMALALALGLSVAPLVVAAPTASAVSADPAGDAVNWAEARVGQHIYDGLCLQFVADAYSSAGVNIGSAPSALTYWNNHPAQQHSGDTNPPKGALVFWGATGGAYPNPDGHVALDVAGGDTVVSSYEEANHNIHEFSIAARNRAGYPYLGWMMPPGVSASGGGAVTGTLFFIKTKNTGSGKVEIHSVSAASGYQTGIDTTTWFSPADADNGWFQMYGGTLYFVKTKNTGSGHVEVHTATASSGYQNGGHWVSAFSPADADNGWFQIADVNHDGSPDLEFIKTHNATSGRVEFFIADGSPARQYSVVTTAIATALSAGEANNGWFNVAYNGDLIYIKTHNTSSGTVEFFRLTAGSSYQNFSVMTATTYSAADADNGWFSGLDANGNGTTDEVFLKNHNTSSGKIEVFYSDGASGLQQRTFSAASRFSSADANSGWFQLGDKS
jgi:hypothetical protein